MTVNITFVGDKKAIQFLKTLDHQILSQSSRMIRLIATALQDDVRGRIISSDGGTWARPSKWIVAKKNAKKALAGQEKKIKSRLFSGRGQVYFDNAEDWSIDDHDKGFTADAIGPKDFLDPHGRVILVLKNGAPLGLPSGTGYFSFKPKRRGVVPKRRIWPSGPEATTIAVPIVFRWLQQLVAT